MSKDQLTFHSPFLVLLFHLSPSSLTLALLVTSLPGTEPAVGQPGLEPPTAGESMEPPEPCL
jgi:hypothetical protein